MKSPRFALQREIEEELGLVLDPAALVAAGFAESAGDAANPAIVILLYIAPRWSGQAQAREGGEWGWFTFEEAAALAMPPLDVVLLDGLKAALPATRNSSA